MPGCSAPRRDDWTVPYAGRVPVKGRTTSEVEADIAEKLKGKAINPQVSNASNRANRLLGTRRWKESLRV